MTETKRVVRQKKKGPIDPNVGIRIRRLREYAGMTQAELAGNDFTKGFISLLETGRTRISVRAADILAARIGAKLNRPLRAADLIAETPPAVTTVAGLLERITVIAGRTHDPRAKAELTVLAKQGRDLTDPKTRLVPVDGVLERVARARKTLEELEEEIA